MSIFLKFLFGVLQGLTPNIISTIEGALTKEKIKKFLDVNKDEVVDAKDLKILAQGKKTGWLIVVGLLSLVAYFLYMLYTNLL